MIEKNDKLEISGIGSPRFIWKRSEYFKHYRESKADIFE